MKKIKTFAWMYKKLANPPCPHCDSCKVKKNGKKGCGKQNYFCHNCRKQFVGHYKNHGADPKKQACVLAMHHHSSGIRDIHNVLNISIVCVLSILRRHFSAIEEPHFEGRYRRVMIDEMWTFVRKRKSQKRWFWYAMCADTRQILAFQIGKRNEATCKKMFKKLAHLDIAEFCTDNWKAYKKVIPPEKHTISKLHTQKIERQNLNFRTHNKRLARQTICFSKKDEMHYGSIKAFVKFYNDKR